jgi:hypothetical protein
MLTVDSGLNMDLELAPHLGCKLKNVLENQDIDMYIVLVTSRAFRRSFELKFFWLLALRT